MFFFPFKVYAPWGSILLCLFYSYISSYLSVSWHSIIVEEINIQDTAFIFMQYFKKQLCNFFSLFFNETRSH